MIILISGVAGSGKTFLGRALSGKLNWPFFEGDSFHSTENIQKMTSGIPLTDEDRQPWLESIAGKMKEIDALDENAIFACSALKKSYRDLLKKSVKNLSIVFLKGDKQTIRPRFATRVGHFMPESLIESQFEALEEPPPGEALIIEISDNIDNQIKQILSAFRLT